MQSSRPIETDIVLLGAGHAHVEVLRRFAMRPEPGVRLTLIGREPETPYSGMLPGLIRSEYTHQQAHIDLAPLAAMAQARLILAEATAFDPEGRTVTDPRPARYSVRSAVDRRRRHPRRARRRRHRGQTDRRVPRPAAPAGGGPARRRPHRRRRRRPGRRRTGAGAGRPVRRTVAAGAGLRHPRTDRRRPGRRAAGGAAGAGGCRRRTGLRRHRHRHWTRGRLLLSDGSYIEVATALWATGVEGPAFLAASGVACDRAGCIRVTRDLRSVSHPHIFAAGDCAALEGDPRPKAGVWAVRAGAPLADNLRRAATGRALEAVEAAARRTGHPGPGARPRGRLAQRHRAAGPQGLVAEGPHRPALDAHVHRHADGSRSRRADALRRLRRQGRRRGAGRRARHPAAHRRRRTC